MARVGEWGFKGRAKWGCSYKKTTLIVCSINIVVALYVLRSLYASLYIYSDRDSRPTLEYTPDQIRKMEESVRIRKAAEPVELIRLVKALKKELSREVVVELPQPLKLKITNEIVERLKTLRPKANVTEQREFVERWCKEKLKEAKQLALETDASNSTILHEEAEMLVKALESDWTVLLEDMGLWIPAEIVNTEHHDKPEGEEEEELDQILPGRPLPPECHAEVHTDYDGAAVRWGLNHHKDSAADCCQACLDQAKRAKPNEKRCNIWVYCPSESGCHSPDIYEHKLGECWLKYAEAPKLNFKDKYPESYRNNHPSAPLVVPWASGIVGA
ncbi:unnamed protein product [Prunus armeniaca]|uniref:Apple domain-containing protein n=1 Tax=Prunus armeniaca TaxID=36596 RepID=A0A6J5W942_PRUAR|nr:unnamed protein product [Prunus armeniaca]CAB4296953.1 unnamed protein product [Prunus armeniaca]